MIQVHDQIFGKMDWFNPQVPWNSRTRCDVRENLKKSTLEPLKYPSNPSIVASANNAPEFPVVLSPWIFVKTTPVESDPFFLSGICSQLPTARYLREETLRLYSLIQAGPGGQTGSCRLVEVKIPRIHLWKLMDLHLCFFGCNNVKNGACFSCGAVEPRPQNHST